MRSHVILAFPPAPLAVLAERSSTTLVEARIVHVFVLGDRLLVFFKSLGI